MPGVKGNRSPKCDRSHGAGSDPGECENPKLVLFR